jgi:hypothetical protein
VFSVSARGTWVLWTVFPRGTSYIYPEFQFNNESVLADLICDSPDGEILAIYFWRRIRIYLADLSKIRRQEYAEILVDTSLQQMLITPDKKKLVAASAHGAILCWDIAQSMKCLREGCGAGDPLVRPSLIFPTSEKVGSFDRGVLFSWE